MIRKQPSTSVPSGCDELEVERLLALAQHLGQQRPRRLGLGVAVALLLHDRGVDAQRHVVHEEALVDRGVVDAAFDGVGERRARSCAGPRRSRPRSSAKWFRVPADTQTNGRSCSTAIEATRACEPSPPAIPRQSAPSATAPRASSARSRPWSSMTVSTPSEAGQLRPARTARPSRRPTTDCTGAPDAAGARCAAHAATAGPAQDVRQARPGPPGPATARSTSATTSRTSEAQVLVAGPRAVPRSAPRRPSEERQEADGRRGMRVGDDPPSAGDAEGQSDEAEDEVGTVAHEEHDEHDARAPRPPPATRSPRARAARPRARRRRLCLRLPRLPQLAASVARVPTGHCKFAAGRVHVGDRS